MHTILEGWCIMNKPNSKSNNTYDDGNIPKIDLPDDKNDNENVEPLPESTRPRKDGPGGESGE